MNNLAVQATVDGNLGRSDELNAEALQLAERFGDSSTVLFVRANRIWIDFMRGRWDQSLAEADVFVAESETSRHTNEWMVRDVRADSRRARGDSDRALADRLRALELASETGDPSQLLAASSLLAATHMAGERLLEQGRLAEAETEVRKALDFHRSARATLFVEREERVLAHAQRESA